MNNTIRSYYDSDVLKTGPGNLLDMYTEIDAGAGAAERSRRRNALVAAIKQLPALADEQGYSEIPSQAISSAIEFVMNLPINKALPKVASDPDGEVLMVWDGVPCPCSLTFVGGTAYMVVNPGAHSEHLDPTIYNGGHIPPKFIVRIPAGG